MRAIFLGSGSSQGIPVITCKCEVCLSNNIHDKRLRTSIYIETENMSLIIDTGPDFRQQVLRKKIEFLDAILFTHAHKDHTAGLDDIKSYNFKQRIDMPLYGTKETLDQITSEFAYIISKKKYPGIPTVKLHPIENNVFSIHSELITPIRVLHHKLPVFGYRFRNFTYITDASYIDDKEKEKIKGSEILVLNALQKEPHISHFALDQALELIEEIQPKQAYLTHISHKLGKHKEISKELPNHVALAYDNLELAIEN